MVLMLGSFFLNPWMLLGLPAVLIPPIIHLLNRRRYEVVDWGAMQFLHIGDTTRRRIFLEELLLMLLRMGLIAVLVLALAGPFVTSAAIAHLAPHPNRDVVLVFDGSYSMGSTGKEGTPHEKAKEWARAFVADWTPGDSMAVLQAKEQVVPVLDALSHDPDRVRQALEALPPPAGGCDWRPALQRAAALLADSRRTQREIIVLGDGQRQGWADRDSLFRWSLLANQLGYDRPEQSGQIRPSMWVVNVVPERPADPPNWSLTPLETNRLLAPVGRPITFRAALDLHGQKTYAPPYRVRLEIDGRFVRNLEIPKTEQLVNGRVPFAFTHSFAAVGSHLLSVIVEPDPPPPQRPANYTIKDELPGDNRQDFAMEVVRELPVLIVEGGKASGKPRPDFMRQALEARDPTPIVRAQVVPLNHFDAALLMPPRTSKPPNSEVRPRVLILRNVPRLTAAQQEAVTQFLAEGGGVLVTLGPGIETDFYNLQLYRGGKGWLPAHLDKIATETAHLAPGGSDHPALRLFLAKSKDGQNASRFPQLGRVRFSQWWKLTTSALPTSSAHSGVQVAALRTAANDYPFLVEWIDPNRRGRLLLCAVPLDDSWGPEWIRDAGFVPLVHELVYYLAGARSAEFNLEPGQPLRHRLAGSGGVEHYRLHTPLGQTKPLTTNPADKNAYLAAVDRLPRGAMLRIDGIRETGVYRLTTPEGSVLYYVVRPQMSEESDLTPCSDDDRAKVAERFPGLKYQNERGQETEEWISDNTRQELWWCFLVGLIALLCGEVWLTRRIVKNR